MSQDDSDVRNSRSTQQPASSISADFESFQVLFSQNIYDTIEKLLCAPVKHPNLGEVMTESPLEHPNLDKVTKECELKERFECWITSQNDLKHIMTPLGAAAKRKRDGSSTGERERKNLFSDYVAFLNTGEDNTQTTSAYPEKDHGSLITKGSKSDGTLVNKITSILFESEYKFQSSYTVEDATQQLIAYLYNQLWWFRTFMRWDVRKVCGFTVCGRNCKDNHTKEVQISIVVLSMPTKIGGQFQCDEFHAKTFEVGVKALKKVFGHKFYDVSELQKNENKLNVKSPGEMMKPVGLWGDSVWETIPSGTGNLVLRFTPGGKDGKTGEDRKNMAKEYFKDLDCNNPCRKRIHKFIEGAVKPIYIKIKNRASAANWASSKVTKLHWDENLKHWEKLYPKNFYLENEYNTVILMNHVGTRLDKKEKPTIDVFYKKYSQMMKETLRVGELCKLVHGDIHRGNLLYDGKEYDGKEEQMWLIDWDEAIPLGYPTNRAKQGKSERYPCFRGKDEDNLLSKVQLLVLFRDLVKDLYDKVVWVANDNGDAVINVNEGFTELILKVDDMSEREKPPVLSLKGIDKNDIYKNKEHVASQYFNALEKFLEDYSEGIDDHSS